MVAEYLQKLRQRISIDVPVGDQSASLIRLLQLGNNSTIAYLVFGITIALLTISVDIHPFTPNDTAKYYELITSDKNIGLIEYGYQQNGYPIFLSTIDRIASIVGISPFLVGVLIQRLLSLAVVILSVRRSLILGIITAGILLTPKFLATTNILYPELICTPLLGLAALLFWKSTESKHRSTQVLSLITSLVMFLCCILVKLSFAWVAASLFPILLYKGNQYRFSQWSVSLFYFLTFAIFSLCTLENKREQNRAFPLVNTERSSYISLWYSIWSNNPESPSLKGENTPYNYIYSIERDHTLSKREQNRILSNETQELAKASSKNTILLRSQHMIQAFFNIGYDDLKAARKKIYSDTSLTGTKNSHLGNYYVKSNGIDNFLKSFNHGTIPQTIDGWLNLKANSKWPNFVHHTFSIAFILSALLLAIFSIKSGDRTLIFHLIGYALFCLVLGCAYVDLWRYVIPSSLFFGIFIYQHILSNLNRSN